MWSMNERVRAVDGSTCLFPVDSYSLTQWARNYYKYICENKNNYKINNNKCLVVIVWQNIVFCPRSWTFQSSVLVDNTALII